MDDFLTPDEIQRITGRTQPAAQVRWFTRRGMFADKNDAGVVLVHRSEVERKFVSGAPAPVATYRVRLPA